MSVRAIRLFPDEVLRTRCEPVEVFDDELAALVADLVETMYAAPGVGLAAPQIGVTKRVFVVDVSVGDEPGALRVFVNPRLVEESGQVADFEGCLSIPELSEKVDRPQRVVVEAQDADGNPFTLAAEDFLARAICHENDHLDGVLFVDRLRGLRRDKARRQLKRMLREREEVSA